MQFPFPLVAQNYSHSHGNGNSLAHLYCEVSLLAPRDGFAIVPCEHERCRKSCANRVAPGTCPVCRTAITMVMRI